LPRPSSMSLPFRFSIQNYLCISDHCYVCYMSCQSQPQQQDDSNNIWVSTLLNTRNYDTC
jgi:hypothetical protein